jgi:hypothetical protein
VFPAKDEEYARNPTGVQAYDAKLVVEKLSIKDAPCAPEVRQTNRISSLLSIYSRGMFWLLLEEGATISDSDAALVPIALTEFITDPRCGLIQGKGHHLFVRPALIDQVGDSSGRLWDNARAFGLIGKRVGYITIDPRSNNRFDI